VEDILRREWMDHMKGAERIKLNFSRDYEFLGVVLKCDDHTDLYTGYNYETDGCFGCEHLSNETYASKCGKGYVIKRFYLRKDDDNKFVGVCTNRTYGSWGKSTLNCADCMRSYGSMGMTKCRLKYKVKQEIVRIEHSGKK